MFKADSFKTSFRRCDGFNWLTIFVAAILGFMLLLVYPFSSEAAPKSADAGNDLFSPNTTLPFSSHALTSNTGATGALEICNVASGSGLEERIFRFQIGANIYSVPVGGCGAPITLPTGTVTVQELIDGPLTTHGSFSGRFRLLDVSSNVSGAIVNLNLPARTVTVNVREGEVTNPTRLTFTNTFAVSVVVEICNQPSETGISGNFDFTIDALSDTVITVPVGSCSAPIIVNVPTVPGPILQLSQIKVTQLGRAGFELNSVSTFPVDRFNNLAVGTGINNTKPNCIKTADPVEEGCAFDNPGGGYADIDVREGGIASKTTVTFSNSFSSQTARTVFDFDGDGKSDISVFRPSTGGWYLLQSANNSFFGFNFGVSGDVITPADYDGDGKTDIAIFRFGGWYFQRSTLGFAGASLGNERDIPVPADYDGDGDDDVAIYRPSTGGWHWLNWSTGQIVVVSFGTAEDKPTIGDFDGDGKSDIAVFRPSTGSWYRLNSSNNQFVAVQFGVAEDKPTPADFDGDGKTDIAVFRPSTGSWYRLNSNNGEFVAAAFGISEDRPVPADYDGDGKADIAVFRPSDGNWYLLQSTAGFAAIHFGQAGDNPIPAAFVR